MEKLLEKAFKEAATLPDKERENFAAFILEELKKEKEWTNSLESSSTQLASLANEALSEYRSGKTDKLKTDKL